ncbi:hypothetical protein [Nocardia pseudobrasiliensis]|uniref:hypothetical protein n=1 Tax=Nocardia pseudobrasiliensis TaxID=45979 RepID=UPI000831B825|nr:hypothetical protein [Nocardia pseudobrasiliensis]
MSQRQQNSILRRGQDGDPDDPFVQGMRGTYNDLDAEKTAALSVIATLDADDDTEPHRPGAADTALLDALPYLALNLPAAPEPLLRKLFEIAQLAIRLHDDRDQVTNTITLPADHIPDIAYEAEKITIVNTTTDSRPHGRNRLCRCRTCPRGGSNQQRRATACIAAFCWGRAVSCRRHTRRAGRRGDPCPAMKLGRAATNDGDS